MSQNTITRAYLADVVHQELGFSKAESMDVVDAVFEELALALEETGVLKISSFGSFRVREKAARVGRNPKTMEEAVIKARKTVSFYASNLLKEYINKTSEK